MKEIEMSENFLMNTSEYKKRMNFDSASNNYKSKTGVPLGTKEKEKRLDKLCPECGGLISSGETSCQACGLVLDEQE